MFLYMVMPGRDTEEKRIKQIEYLAKEFSVPSDSSEYTLVGDKLMRKGKNRKLFILGHGSKDSYMGQSPEVMYRYLKNVGLSEKHFSEIWLMPCLVGQQEQDNSVTKNFARDFKTELHQGTDTSVIKLYAPRGVVRSYYQKEGSSFRSCDKICVAKDGKEYGFKDGGWLLVGGSGVW